MALHTIEELKMRQALPLDIKIKMTQTRIRQWVDHWGVDGVYVSFSGGKDSTVLLHLVRELFPDVPAVFLDTGLEFPEIREFVRTFDNVVWLKPNLTFKQVIDKYGYPFMSKEISSVIGGGQKSLAILEEDGIDISNRDEVLKECKKRLKKEKGEWRRLAQCYGAISKNGEVQSDLTKEEKGSFSDIPSKYKFLLSAPFFISNRCCDVMKKTPAHKYEKETGRHPMTAQMTCESRLRERSWLKSGCNAFENNHPMSNPMAIWTEQDVLRYIKENNIPIASVYGDIVAVCGDEMEGQIDFADLGLTDDNRLLKTTKMKRTGCMFCGYGCHFEQGTGRFELMKETHPKQYEYIMKPKEQGGLDYKNVIDWINENGNMDIRY